MNNEAATQAATNTPITATPTRTLTVCLPDGNVIPYARLALMLYKPMDAKNMMAHAAMGLTGEAGEYSDAIKKHIFYGKELDTANVIEELGDIAFYLQAACNTHGVTIEEVIQANANKLAKRYASLVYNDADAISRRDKE